MTFTDKNFEDGNKAIIWFDKPWMLSMFASQRPILLQGNLPLLSEVGINCDIKTMPSQWMATCKGGNFNMQRLGISVSSRSLT